MPDVLLFGATGYTGRLTAAALARRGVDFVIAGRDRDRLAALAAKVGGPETRVCSVGDVQGLERALADVKVLITCVGPFVELGDTAVEAAVRSNTHYLDSSGESTFIARLFVEKDAAARDAGVAMAPAMGFDEIPADVAATLAVEGLERPRLIMTYAVESGPSGGTARTLPGILSAPAAWRLDGKPHGVRFGECHRWAPLPPPLGPRPSISAPFAIGELAPTHLELRDLEFYMALPTWQARAVRVGAPLMRALMSWAPARRGVASLGGRLDGPSESGRKAPWTLLAEASTDGAWRNVVARGEDVYGLTAELLAAGATAMSADGYDRAGVLAPVAAIGLEPLLDELKQHGVTFETTGSG